MEKDKLVYIILTKIALKDKNISDEEKEQYLKTILRFMGKIPDITIGDLEDFNKASEQDPELAEKLGKIILRGKKGQYPSFRKQ